jgi:hypothetical protein
MMAYASDVRQGSPHDPRTKEQQQLDRDRDLSFWPPLGDPNHFVADLLCPSG